MASNDGFTQRKGLAMGEDAKSGGSFGCEPLSSANGGGKSMGGGGATILSDDKRAGPKGVSRGSGMMPGTAHSDHGPHCA